MNKNIRIKIINLPSDPGIYQFYDINDRIIYIGKASVLKNRVKSYFVGTRDNKTQKLVSEIFNIKWQTTKSVIEAIILESNLIKNFKPKYNIREKDDKSFVQIALTAEDFPRLILFRPTDKDNPPAGGKIKKLYGPYTEGGSIREILSIFRKIFTFRDCTQFKFNRHKKKGVPCLYYSLNLCPAPCAGFINKKDYLNIINHIIDILDGKSKKAINALKKEMKLLSNAQKFEEAAKVRNQIHTYEHINDIAVIKSERSLEQFKNIPARIEAYDISNIGKDYAVGSMVVFMHGEIDKNEYRKFRINYKLTNHTNLTNNSKYQDDPYMIGQILDRRMHHPEWQVPDLILIDGGKGQFSAAIKTIKTHKLKIPVIAIAKGPTRKGFKLYKNTLANKINLDKRFLESIRDEAHRFAIAYHRKLREKLIKH